MKIKVLFIILCSMLITFPLNAQIRWNQRWQNYIDKYKDIAITEMHKYGIPASITLAQGLLESAAGESELAVKGNNHFGIKSHGWQGRTMRHNDDLVGEKFRVYDSALESFEDHSQFLAGRSRYQSLFSYSNTDYRNWAHGLKRAGYATNPQYAYRLINIIETYRLYEYDKASPRVETKQQQLAATQLNISSNVPKVPEQHRVLAFNDNFYIRAKQGDTFKKIGKEMGINYRHLAKWNERDADETLKQGEIIWLSKKKKCAPSNPFKQKPYYYVTSAVSMYDVAQQYGIKLKSLMKMNPQLAKRDYHLRIGDFVRIHP